MAAKYLKSLKPYAITLYTGRTDIPTCLTISPDKNSVLLYDYLVNIDDKSDNFNASLINGYIYNNILTIITIPDIIPVGYLPM